MTRAEFMERLEALLQDVSPAEREEAIQYYNDYFEDAGEEEEEGIIDALGTPEQVAGTIKAGLSGSSAGEFTEKGFQSYEREKTNEILNPQTENTKNAYEQNPYRQNGTKQNTYQENAYEQNPYGQNNIQPKKDKLSGGMIVLIVILCILASPFLIGLAGAAFGVIVGILGALFGIIIGFGAATVALIATGIALFVYGITLLFGLPLGGLCFMGGGMICAGIGLLFLWLTVLICGTLLPMSVRGIVNLIRKIFHIGGAKA